MSRLATGSSYSILLTINSLSHYYCRGRVSVAGAISSKSSASPDLVMEPWRSYDSVANVYDRLVVPHVFAQPAKDLVSALHPAVEGILLDVGTGTACVRPSPASP